VVATGDTLETGTLRLTFIQAMMCHWPDSMMTHVGSADGGAGPAVLLSNDAFGQHFTRAAFDDAADAAELWFEAEKYFVNIISPYCRNVQQRLKELGDLGLPVRMIAPSHGVIWRRDVAKVIDAYGRWAAQRTEPRCVICFDTMYDSTRRMAEAVAEGLAAAGVAQRTFHLPTSDRSDVLPHLYGARGILVGSSVWHMNVLPSVATLLEDLKTLRFQKRLVGAFGSYGWQKLGAGIIEARAREAGYEVPLDGVMAHWKPRHEDLQACREFGEAFGERVLGA
jgi:flavorubredoxin